MFDSNFIWALGASIAVSFVSFVGVIALLLSEKVFNKILIFMIAFAAGGLIGGAFLHLLPESFTLIHDPVVGFIYTLSGFILFFILEKYFYWRHCHKGKCDIHIFTYLNLFGDGIHNFIDGIIIGASFTVDIKFGLVTTLAIILHEIPQELGDFGVLIYGGFSKIKALLFNFLSALTAVLGTIIGYYFANKITAFSMFLLPFAAGGFIYIASCDLIPELHRQPDLKISTITMLVFLSGILLMLLLKLNLAY